MKFRALIWAAALCCSLELVSTGRAEVNKAEKVGEGVYFHEGDIGRKGHCNNGWIIFSDYVLVVDGNFPSGANEVIPKIRAMTDKPIRFAFNTHAHGDHAYGNRIWHEAGAVAVAHEGVLDEMKSNETGYFGDRPGRWEDLAKNRKDVADTKLHPPSLLFRNELFFEDKTQRVELLYFGVAHTRGDGWAWLPKERILFTGDACVNGPYNYVGDGNVDQWIRTLEAVRKLKPRLVCPGHGPVGGPEVLDQQLRYFVTLRNEIRKLHAAGKTAVEVKESVETLKGLIRKDDEIARYLGTMFEGQVEKIHIELGGKPFQRAADRADKHWREARLTKP